MDSDGGLIPRAELVKKFQISDASEWRQRSGGEDWPPHLLIGTKVYYRVSQIDDWLRRREAASPRTGEEATFESVVRQAKKLADRAPSLSAAQQAVIDTLLALPAEGES
jgi:predicted DNA-binding transcriptional regulator AlpA